MLSSLLYMGFNIKSHLCDRIYVTDFCLLKKLRG